MKRMLTTGILFILSIFLCLSITYGAKNKDRMIGKPVGEGTYTVGYQQFDGNRISSWTSNAGDWVTYTVTGTSGMEWPKDSGKTAVFHSGLWVICGEVKEKDSAEFRQEIRTAVAEYATEFSPGQIVYYDTLNQEVVPTDNYPQEHCIWQAQNPGDSSYKLYKINRGDSLSSDYLNWPAEQGAPADGEGNPLFAGDQMLWSVYNDMNPKPHESQFMSTPLGIEIQATLFGFDRNDPLKDVLFIKTLIINKSDNHYRDMYTGIWGDPDLGNALDDYAGVDSLLNMAYCFNGNPVDRDYGDRPPAVGFTFLQKPHVESPGDTAYWSGKPRYGWKETGLSGFVKFKVHPLFAHPDTKEEAYNFIRGLTLNGDPMINPVTGKETRFHLSGDPVTEEGWLDRDDANPGDRWFLFGAGPFEMAPCDTQEIVTAILLARGRDHIHSVEALRYTRNYVQDLFDSNFDFESITSVADIMDAVNNENLDRHVRILSGDTTAMIGGSEQCIDKRYYILTTTVKEENDVPLAEQYLTETLESYGYSVTARPVNLDLDINDLLIVKEGSLFPESYVMMTAFYNGIECWAHPSIVNPSADMNGSGVAALLECARILKDVETPYSVLFALWGAQNANSFYTTAWPENPFMDHIIFNVDVEAIGFDTLGLKEINAQYVEYPQLIPAQEHVLERLESIISMGSVDLSVSRCVNCAGYGQLYKTTVPSISFTQTIDNPDTTNPYLVLNPNMGGRGSDRIDFFNMPVFHDRAKAVVGLVADLAMNGLPDYFPTSVHPVEKAESFALHPNYPNPFNPVTTLGFTLPEPIHVILNVYDITGRLTEQLINQYMNTGYHTLIWDASRHSSGIYIVRIQAGHYVNTQKIALIK